MSQSEHGYAYFKEINCGARAVDYQTTVQRKAPGLAGEQHMATNRNEMNQEEQSSPWLGFAKVLFVIFLIVIILLLANSMVRHHFFSGGQMNQHDVNGA